MIVFWLVPAFWYRKPSVEMTTVRPYKWRRRGLQITSQYIQVSRQPALSEGDLVYTIHLKGNLMKKRIHNFLNYIVAGLEVRDDLKRRPGDSGGARRKGAINVAQPQPVLFLSIITATAITVETLPLSQRDPTRRCKKLRWMNGIIPERSRLCLFLVFRPPGLYTSPGPVSVSRQLFYSEWVLWIIP